MTTYVVTDPPHTGLYLARRPPRASEHVWATLPSAVPHRSHESPQAAREDTLSTAELFRAVRDTIGLERGQERVWP